MGGTSWSSDSYRSIKHSYTAKSKDDIFTSKSVASDMSPIGVAFRESRDSDAHPNSLAIMVFLDETGSMGDIPYNLAKNKLGALMETIIKHGVPDAHILFGGIGDQYSDKSPLQVGQFEAGTTELDQWLTKIYLEGKGGGQNMESYLLAWLFAARHTSIDCFEKRGVKGFLFTIGDEKTWPELKAAELKKIMGYSQSEDVSAETLLSEAQQRYHVFHIHANETGYRNDSDVLDSWRDILGERLIICDDNNAIPEVIASTVAVVNGADLASITKSFDSHTADVVSNALVNVKKDITKTSDSVITL